MSIVSIIDEKYIAALKARDGEGKRIYSNIKAELQLVAKTKANPNEQDYVDALGALAKKRRKSIEQFEIANRADLIEREQSELTVIEGFLPKMMSDDEIKAALDQIIKENNLADAPENKLMGQTMGFFNKKYRGLADMTKVANFIKEVI